jgi:hypothetical protein
LIGRAQQSVAETAEPGDILSRPITATPWMTPAAKSLRNADLIIPQRAHLIGHNMVREDLAACCRKRRPQMVRTE